MTAQKYMYEMIDERRASKEERHDLLSRLLEENDSGDTVMSNREILCAHDLTSMGRYQLTRLPANIFIFLEAGHEVSARLPFKHSSLTTLADYSAYLMLCFRPPGALPGQAREGLRGDQSRVWRDWQRPSAYIC